ncbi:MAG: NnrS family protein [Pseudomonadota bacterium]|nr:NnrS family protein [Pseudomonadota bacterium]
MSAAPLESWRLYFPTAAALAVAGLAAWGAQLAGVPLGLLPGDHASFMLWGVMGAGVQGFLLTAYAKQNGAPLPARGTLLTLLSAHLVASAVLLLRPPIPAPLAAVLAALPWAGLLAWAAPVARTSLRNRWDPTTAAVPVALLGALLGVFLHVLGTARPRGIELGVHVFLVPMALAILDRILPFFSSRTPGYAGGRRPYFLGPLLALSWLKVLAPLAVPALTPFVNAALVLLLVRQWWGWRPWPAARTPMIGILHVGVGWFVVAWLLEVVGAPRSASLHALLVGGLGALLLGISMRVARGHSGLPVVVGWAGAAVLVLAQLAAMGRVWAGLGAVSPLVLVVSAVLLASAFVVWLVRFLPVAVRR